MSETSQRQRRQGNATFVVNTIGERGAQGVRGIAGIDGVSAVGPNPFWNVPNWYVNPLTGNDNNTGTGPATPVRTVMGGIVARWGTTSPIIDQTVTIRLLAPETQDQEAVVLSPILVNGANFIIRGTNTVLGTTTISSIVTQLNFAAGTSLTLTLSAPIIGLAPGDLVINTTNNSHATIDEINGNNLTMTQPLFAAGLTTVSPYPTVTDDNGWAVGNTLRFERYPLLNLKVLEPKGGDASTPAGNGPVFWLQNIFIPSEGSPGFSQLSPFPAACSLVFSDCHIDPFVTMDAQLVFFTGQFQNVFLNGGSLLGTFARLFGGSSNAFLGNYTGMFGGIVDHNAILHGNGSVVPPGATMGQVRLTGGNFSVYFGATVSIFRSTPDAVIWGDSALFVNQSESAVVLYGFGGALTWTQALQLTGGLFLNGSATGSAFNPLAAGNPFTPGIPITSANLNANTGLQNPLTGARFAGPIGDVTFFLT